MESKYEYKFNGPISIAPAQAAKHNPPAKEFGEAVMWFYVTQCPEGNSPAIVDKLVAAGKFVWLDWLAEKGFVTRTEKRRELAIKDMELVECSEGVALRVEDKGLLVFSKNGSVRRCKFAENDLIPTDEEGRIIIK